MNIIKYLRLHGIKGTFDTIYRYKIDQQLRKLAILITKDLPLENTIIIESHNDFDSNGGAFYDYLIENHYNKKYKIVWLIKNKKPSSLPRNVYSYYLYKPSLRKQLTISRAKYILCCQDKIGSIRKEQISLYMTHGPVGLKSIKGKCLLPNNLTYVLMPSEYLQPIMEQQYEIENTTIKRIILGYPMHDILYSSGPGDLHKLTEKKYKKVILWMPTFRKGIAYGRNDSTVIQPLGIPIFDNERDIQIFNQYLKDKNALLIIKIHPMQDMSTVKLAALSNISVLDGQSIKKLGIDNYRLMKDSDALISDYSSVAYDYLHLDRPIAFTMDDAKDYKLGFIVDDPNELICGHIIKSKEEFMNFINDVLSDKDPFRNKRHEVFNKVFKFHDGNSSKRIAEFLNL